MNIVYAGTNVTVRTHASITPTATKMPKTCTGGIGVRASEANPAADVSDVYSMGENSSPITLMLVARGSRVS